jgi:hypothetical protein
MFPSSVVIAKGFGEKEENLEVLQHMSLPPMEEYHRRVELVLGKQGKEEAQGSWQPTLAQRLLPPSPYQELDNF